MLRRRFLATALLVASALTAAGCAGAGEIGASGQTLTVAIVANPQMNDAISLESYFKQKYPGVDVRFVTLPENEARAKITASVATGGGEYDAVMISNYEAPLWAKNRWLVDLQPYINNTPGYDPQDIIPTVRSALSYQGNMYAVPFYGESSFLVYRKDLLSKVGVTLPDRPTWQQVADAAAKVDDPAHGVRGICLRGLPGWGELLAPLNTVVNTWGGRWFDLKWNAQLTQKPFVDATSFYVNLVKAHGEPGASSSGFSECATRYSQGQVAMWYDATSMTSIVENPTTSMVVGKNGYAAAPVVRTQHSGWLYSWALAIPTTSTHKQQAWDFLSWMTDKNYIQLVGKTKGWASVPPGSRLSTYQIPEYQKVSQAYAGPTLSAMEAADQNHPTLLPVPYTGIQFVAIPEFQDLGTRVSQQISSSIAGQRTVEQALQQSQQYADTVGRSYR
jgi:sorbitol/mannitol transport system substrate-binding protein